MFSSYSHFALSLLAAAALVLPSPQHTIAYIAGMLRPPTPHATVLFGGDIMFDRSVRTTIDKKGGDFIFSCIDPYLWSADVAMANLEGPITDKPSISATSQPGDGSNYTFTFPLTSAALLYAHNIRVVNVGNNHIENFGISGVRSTVNALANADVDYFGDPLSHSVAHRNIRGVPLAFVGYNEFLGRDSSASTTLRQIREARAAGFIPLVYTHWGIEYSTTSPERIQVLAHTFIDAGAEMVIGSHPHVVENNELYNGKHIYYSLGNFIFDQYFSDNVTHGLLLNVVFTPAGVASVQEIPVYLGKDRRTCAEQSIVDL